MKKICLLLHLICATYFSQAQIINVSFTGIQGSEVWNTGNSTSIASVTNFSNSSSLTINVVGCPATPIFDLRVNGVQIPNGSPVNTAGTITLPFPANTFNGLYTGDVVNLRVTCGAAIADYNNIFSATLISPVNNNLNVFDVMDVSYPTLDP